MNRTLGFGRASACALACCAIFSVIACGSSARDPIANATATGDGGAGSSGQPGAFVDSGPNDLGASADAAVCPNVDILFVIDNSGSMSDKQARLAQSFPGFANAIQTRLPAAKSVHVGVVATSSYYALAPQECLIKKTEGPQSTNAQCLSGAPYLDAQDPGFAQQFACVAKVGSGGDDDEKPMKSLLGALAPKQNAPGACNEGFSRRDALLVIVLITDEDDVKDNDCDPQNFSGTCGSGGTPSEWAKQIIQYKDGHPENVMVMSLVARKIGDCSNTVSTNVTSFTHEFGAHGTVGDVCSPSYDQFFTDALPIFDQACAAFVAPK